MAQVVPESSNAENGDQVSIPTSNKTNSNELHQILSTFDIRINKMMDYPAKDIINELTMLAEQTRYASEIVSFLETKIHRVNETKYLLYILFSLCCVYYCLFYHGLLRIYIYG